MTLEDDDSIAVKVRGPVQNEKECFFFLEEILGCVDQVRFLFAILFIFRNISFIALCIFEVVNMLYFGT